MGGEGDGEVRGGAGVGMFTFAKLMVPYRFVFFLRLPVEEGGRLGSHTAIGLLSLKLHYDIPLTLICYYFNNQVYASLNLVCSRGMSYLS